ncbi:MAG: glycosyltransferase family 4 protein, partial [Candidatus Thermoplasmatota archaeon]|nr:glycosyltransferase family 4 protein [Candidatus Thermoplasmatota archaeon]
DISRFTSLPDKTAFKNRYNLSGKIILNISRLAVSKGQKYLIKAFSQIIPDFPDLKLVIIGEDWGEMKNLKLLVKNLRLEDKVLLPGLVSAQDVLEAFSASEIFVLPSLAEGLPTVILEAMASGLPIVATDVGGVAETLNGVGLVIRAANANQLAENMRKLLEDDELRKRCSKLGRERVKRYDWPRVARDVVRVYEDILGVK